nr:hypothetical protein [Apilactobacillus ozensis]
MEISLVKKGIPTPNLFNGGENFHGPYEFITTENMLLTYNTIKTIIINHFNN